MLKVYPKTTSEVRPLQEDEEEGGDSTESGCKCWDDSGSCTWCVEYYAALAQGANDASAHRQAWQAYDQLNELSEKLRLEANDEKL